MSEEEKLKRYASDLIRKMQASGEEPLCHGQLCTEAPRVPKTIYIAVDNGTDVSMYLEPPPFSDLKWVGYLGRAWHLRRIKRGLSRSTFALWGTAGPEEVQYTTSNAFGDLLYEYITDTPSEKCELCRKAAESGDPKSQFHLGGFYQRGQAGLSQDYFKAAKWYRRAAEQGHAGAQLYLGIFLAQGPGVEQDLAQAYKWIDLAKRGNVFDRHVAVQALEKLVPLMNPAQLDYGKMWSQNFVPTREQK